MTNWKNPTTTVMAVFFYYYLLWHGLMFQVILLAVLSFLGWNYLYTEREALGMAHVIAKRPAPTPLIHPVKQKRSMKEKIGRIYDAGYKMQTRTGSTATSMEKLKKYSTPGLFVFRPSLPTTQCCSLFLFNAPEQGRLVTVILAIVFAASLFFSAGTIFEIIGS